MKEMEEMEEMEGLTRTLNELDIKCKKALRLKVCYMEHYDKLVELREALDTVKNIMEEFAEENKQVNELLRELVTEETQGKGEE